jgi:chromosome segregation ATPase
MMSPAEKHAEVGRLADEYSQLKGELHHLNERLTELVQIFEHRERLSRELHEKANRLRELAPNLL